MIPVIIGAVVAVTAIAAYARQSSEIENGKNRRHSQNIDLKERELTQSANQHKRLIILKSIGVIASLFSIACGIFMNFDLSILVDSFDFNFSK